MIPAPKNPPNPAVDAIEELRALRPGWDSYEAAPISPEAVDTAKGYLAQVEQFLGAAYANPTVGPTTGGGVALVWRKLGRAEVSAILSPGERPKFVVVGGSRRVEAKGTIHNPQRFALDVLKRYLA